MTIAERVIAPGGAVEVAVGRENRQDRLRRVHYLMALLLTAVAALLTGDAWLDLIAYGLKDEESSHVLLVPVAVAWIALVRRESLVRCPRKGTWVGPVLALGGLVSWTLGWRYDVQVAWHGGAVLFTFGAAVTALGTEMMLRLWPAVLVLVLLIPVPATGRLLLARPMQGVAATVTEEVAQVLFMDVTRSGYLLSFNGRQVTVAEACNGMRMAFTLLLACYVFAFTTPLHNSVRLLILLASPLVAVVANVVRLVPTIWAYGHFSPETSDLIHNVGGWAMLFAAFLSLTGLIRVLKWLSIPVAPRGVYAS